MWSNGDQCHFFGAIHNAIEQAVNVKTVSHLGSPIMKRARAAYLMKKAIDLVRKHIREGDIDAVEELIYRTIGFTPTIKFREENYEPVGEGSFPISDLFRHIDAQYEIYRKLLGKE